MYLCIFYVKTTSMSWTTREGLFHFRQHRSIFKGLLYLSIVYELAENGITSSGPVLSIRKRTWLKQFVKINISFHGSNKKHRNDLYIFQVKRLFPSDLLQRKTFNSNNALFDHEYQTAFGIQELLSQNIVLLRGHSPAVERPFISFTRFNKEITRNLQTTSSTDNPHSPQIPRNKGFLSGLRIIMLHRFVK